MSPKPYVNTMNPKLRMNLIKRNPAPTLQESSKLRQDSERELRECLPQGVIVGDYVGVLQGCIAIWIMKGNRNENGSYYLGLRGGVWDFKSKLGSSSRFW